MRGVVTTDPRIMGGFEWNARWVVSDWQRWHHGGRGGLRCCMDLARWLSLVHLCCVGCREICKRHGAHRRACGKSSTAFGGKDKPQCSALCPPNATSRCKPLTRCLYQARTRLGCFAFPGPCHRRASVRKGRNLSAGRRSQLRRMQRNTSRFRLSADSRVLSWGKLRVVEHQRSLISTFFSHESCDTVTVTVTHAGSGEAICTIGFFFH